MPFFFKRSLAFAHDLLAVCLTWLMAYWLRFNLEIPPQVAENAQQTLWLVLALHLPAFAFFGLYRGIWRYASLMDLRRIILACSLAALLVAFAVFMAKLPDVPRSVLLLHPLLLILTMGGSRFVYRAFRDRALYGHVVSGEPVLVLGSSEGADRLLRELQHSSVWSVVGLLTDEPARIGQELRGVRLIGHIDDVARWSSRLQVNKVIVAMPGATQAARRHAMEASVQAGLGVLTVPDLSDILSGRLAVSAVRKVELEDLLGRDPVTLDSDGLNDWLHEKTVLVTGAGGSIGSELVRQILVFKPRCLVLLELSEFALYQIEQELQRDHPQQAIACVVADVKDAARIDAVFRRHRPEVVFHAAAYKHVPLMEADNAWQAIRNNVGGSAVVADAASRHGCDKFVLISTDKAVNPTNVMGASKRLAERALAAHHASSKTRFITVRFGNVLGSNGSVIPKFRQQIASGGPVTVTHPDIIRYFMLIPEAAQLVLQAGLMGDGGEVFVLEMGEPIRIADLARDMIRLSGYSEEDIRIAFTGLRPGEKLYEELLTDNEHTLPTPHPKLRVARSEVPPDAAWQQAVAAWLSSAEDDTAAIKDRLRDFVPEYTPYLPES